MAQKSLILNANISRIDVEEFFMRTKSSQAPFLSDIQHRDFWLSQSYTYERKAFQMKASSWFGIKTNREWARRSIEIQNLWLIGLCLLPKQPAPEKTQPVFMIQEIDQLNDDIHFATQLI